MVEKCTSRHRRVCPWPTTLVAGILLAAALAFLTPQTGFAGYCAGGIDYGKPCFTSMDCRKTCAGGVDVGQACLTDSSCRKTCAGGIDVGKACTGDSTCRMTCYGGARTGQACTSSVDCLGSACLGTTCLSTTCLGTSCVGSFAELDSQRPDEEAFFASLTAQPVCGD